MVNNKTNRDNNVWGKADYSFFLRIFAFFTCQILIAHWFNVAQESQVLYL